MEKTALAKRTGLKRGQVGNWFINARVRIWRPAIFSMCQEMEQTQPASSAGHGLRAQPAELTSELAGACWLQQAGGIAAVAAVYHRHR